MLAKTGKHGFQRRPLAMTSLIDVIFLLLLFFLLTSTFSKYAEVELLSAGAGATKASEQAPVFLRLGQESLSLNGNPQVMDDLVGAFDTKDASGPKQTVLVSLDDAVSSQRLVDLLEVLAGINGLRVQVLGGK